MPLNQNRVGIVFVEFFEYFREFRELRQLRVEKSRTVRDEFQVIQNLIDWTAREDNRSFLIRSEVFFYVKEWRVIFFLLFLYFDRVAKIFLVEKDYDLSFLQELAVFRNGKNLERIFP